MEYNKRTCVRDFFISTSPILIKLSLFGEEENEAYSAPAFDCWRARLLLSCN